MQWITIATPSFASIKQVDQVVAQLDGPPEGLEARYVGTAADGTLRVVSLWQSKEQAEQFLTEKLGPAVARALGPEPSGAIDLVGIDVQRSYLAQPVG